VLRIYFSVSILLYQAYQSQGFFGAEDLE
jgi:hypothetical protein